LIRNILALLFAAIGALAGVLLFNVAITDRDRLR
jgi:hypothetical protein